MRYNDANQLTVMQKDNEKITYRYDKNGSMVEKTLKSRQYGTLTDDYRYNAQDMITGYDGYDGYKQEFTYSANGIRLTKSESGNAERSTLEELLRGNIAGLPDVVEPVQGGNISEDESVPKEYEWATTEYLYDLTQEYYQVISETTTSTGGTSVTTAYAYGLERIAAYGTNADGEAYRTDYVYDGRGSVAQTVTVPAAGQSTSSSLTNVQVTVQSFAYTAYGEQMGTVKVSGFTYNVEAYDAATGMLNLRARQYEPAMNRFSQKDMHSPSLVLTLAWNEYLFTYNSPLNWIDANGLIPDDPFDENVQKEYIAEQRAALFNIKRSAKALASAAKDGYAASSNSNNVYIQYAYKEATEKIKEIEAAENRSLSEDEKNKIFADICMHTSIKLTESYGKSDKKIAEINTSLNKELSGTQNSDENDEIYRRYFGYYEDPEIFEELKFMFDMYGFEKEEVQIMSKVFSAFEAYDSELPDAAAHNYTLAIGRMVYGDGDSVESMKWDGTVGNLSFSGESLFVNLLGLTQREYELLRYKVRMQNQILGDIKNMSYEAIENTPNKLAQYKASMEKALGKTLSDSEFKRLWTNQYNAMSTASDYAHYNITQAAIFATDYPPSIGNIKGYLLRFAANWAAGKSDTSREDMAGWLGDATIRTNNNKKVSFSPDDYKADLDADNVMNIMDTQNVSYIEAETIYFKKLENGETRAEIFLSHTSLEFVVSEILSELEIESLEDLKTEEPEAYAFIYSLEHNFNELELNWESEGE